MTEPTKKKSICGCSMCEFHTTAYEIAVERGDIVDEPSAGAVQNRQTTTSELGEFRPQEVINRIEYKYMQTDGTIDFPNSYEGDTLRIAYKTAKFIEQKYIRREQLLNEIDEKVKFYGKTARQDMFDNGKFWAYKEMQGFCQTLNLEPKEK